ncbi:hypothetical protein IJT17_10000, partial [bacterium]|nr:hypothetical protein [bacterium]
MDKAVEASATHVVGYAYDAKGQKDSKFAIEETEIAKMQKAENGDYLAKLNVSGYVRHIELYFYYKEGDEKFATNCKYIHTDFASRNRDGDIIIDCDADDVYFTIKTYDSLSQETNRFTSGDKVYAKVFVTWHGDDYFYDSVINEERTFSLGGIISDATDVVDNSAQQSDEYRVLDALAQGTANLYVYNLGFTCLFSEHEVSVEPAAPDYTALYLAPNGYTVSRDGSKILDPDGTEADPANLPGEQEIVAGGEHTFVAIGAKQDDAGVTYELLGDTATAVLTTESANITNDGFKVSVAAGSTAADTASIQATMDELTSNAVSITVAAPVTYTALYLAPEGYAVNDDHTSIVDPNGTEVAADELPAEQGIAAGHEHVFVAIGAKNDGTAVTYELLGNTAEAVLTTESANIANTGFCVSISDEATAADTATIKAVYDDLTSNIVNIAVTVNYAELYIVPNGYTVSDDGTQIL